LRVYFPARLLPRHLQSDEAQEAGHDWQCVKICFEKYFIGGHFQPFLPEDARQLRG
jgi:hypothetical protein